VIQDEPKFILAPRAEEAGRCTSGEVFAYRLEDQQATVAYGDNTRIVLRGKAYEALARKLAGEAHHED
jgi:hypothetical protein